jgi:O-antigen/teichoic acid export membrane protein
LNSSKQIKIGALISYGTIAFHIIAGLIYTPWMISKIGQSDFGIYTLATSLITMFVMDFGLGAAVSRFVSKYRAENRQDMVNNFVGLVYKLYLLVDAVILVALLAVYCCMDIVYGNLTPEELEKLRVLYVIVASFSVISFPFSNLNGIITAYESFIALKLCDFFNKALTILLIVIALLFDMGVYALVTVNALVGLITIAVKLLIIKIKTPVRVNFRYFDKSMFKNVFGFSMWTTVGNLMQRLVLSISPTIITAVCINASVEVAIFGLASTVEGYIYTFATAINGMFLPRISKIYADGKKETDLLPLMIKVGRIQFILVGLISVGFIALGKSFIVDIWNKPDFSQSYICAVLLLIPNMFYLPMQIANTAVVVENKVKLQAIIFIVMNVVNIAFSFVFGRLWGAAGVALALLVSYLVRILLMCIVYKRVMHMDIVKFVKEVFIKLSPNMLLTLGVGLLTERFNPLSHGILRFCTNGFVVVAVFLVSIILFGLNQYEKKTFLGFLGKFKRN